MGDRRYFETERDIFCVGDECVVYQMRITDRKEEAHQLLEKYMRCVWKGFQRGQRGQFIKTALTISGGLSITVSVSKVDGDI
jgi:hypothetical protein